jgi:hypothetical protein
MEATMRGEHLDRDATTLFALEQYRSLKKPNGDPFYYHPRKVAKIAEMLVIRDKRARATGSFLMPADLQIIEESWHAGWLHDSMSKGAATFDDVCHLTNIRVAQWVSGLSEDNRLPGPRRVAAYVNQLAGQPDPVKIIKLADLGHSLDEMVELVKIKPKKSKELIGHWPDEVIRILEAITSVRTVALVDEFRWCVHAAAYLAKCVRKPEQAAEIIGGVVDCPIKAPKKKRRRRRRTRSS